MSRDRRVTPDGTALVTETRPGSGPLVVVLHGFTGDHTTMEPFADALSATHEVLLVDLIGHGDSDAPDRLEPYRMASVVDQVLSLVADRDPGTVHLAGYSMGGRIALSMAHRAPWFFASIAVMSATAGIADPVERAERQRRDQMLADRVEAIGVSRFVEEWLAADLFGPLRACLGARGLRAEIAARSTATAIGLANSLRGTGQGSMPPLWEGLGNVRSPLLALAGEGDPTYVQLAERLARSAHDGRVVTVARCGHALPMEKPARVAGLVLEFLRSLDEPS